VDGDVEIDHLEAAAAKELAIRLVLAVIFIALAYMGIAGAFERTSATETGSTDATHEAVTR
jgi:hypothetical protein